MVHWLKLFWLNMQLAIKLIKLPLLIEDFLCGSGILKFFLAAIVINYRYILLGLDNVKSLYVFSPPKGGIVPSYHYNSARIELLRRRPLFCVKHRMKNRVENLLMYLSVHV